MKKWRLSLLFTALLTLMLATGASAANCSCGRDEVLGKSFHNDIDHNIKWYPGSTNATESIQHELYCVSCVELNKHAATCEIFRKIEPHQLYVSGTGENRKKICSKCGYSEDFPCDHSDGKYTEMGGTDKTHCYYYCNVCKKTVDSKTKAHNWKAVPQKDTNVTAHQKHSVKCMDCGYSYDAEHKFVKRYTPYPDNKQPVTPTSSMVNKARDHKTVVTCSECGYSYTEGISTYGNTVAHTFVNDKCTLCGLKRNILPKVKGLSAKQQGSVRVSKGKISPSITWDGHRFKFYPGGTYTRYTYKAVAKWSKTPKAAGYVVSLGKLKTGDYVTEMGLNFIKKTNATYSFQSTSRLKNGYIYVAPVDSYGYIGKVSKVKVSFH